MKTSFAVLAFALASVATAQLDAIPSCALSCFVTALSADGCSSLTDFKCHCAKTELISTVKPCVDSECSAADQAAAVKAVSVQCEQVGVPIVLPGAASSAPASSAAPSSAAPVSSAAPAYSSSSSAAASSSSVAPSSSAAAYSTPAVSTPVTTAVSTVKPSNGTITTAAPSQFTGAASAPQAAGVMAVAGFFLAAAL